MNQVLLVETETKQDWELEIIELARQRDEVTPEMVVEAARAESSALHGRFVWDDTKAAAEYRLYQARGLIRSVRITYINPDEDAKPVRRFVHCLVDDVADKPRSVYKPMASVITSQDFTNQMLGDAKRDLASFKRKYEVLAELQQVIASIDGFLLQ